MGTDSWSALPSSLARARERFESWRRTRTERRIPEDLWALAAKLADFHGVHRTSQALRLNPQSLRERRGSSELAAPVDDRTTGGFMELQPVGLGNSASWVVELSSPVGTRLRIEGRGEAPLDAVALAREFLSSAR